MSCWCRVVLQQVSWGCGQKGSDVHVEIPKSALTITGEELLHFFLHWVFGVSRPRAGDASDGRTLLTTDQQKLLG